MSTRIADANNALELAGLSELKRKAKSGDQSQEKEALHEVAKQFESIFMQMMLKSMRQANEVLESDSPFNSQSTKFYRDMHDQQMALELSNNGSLGLSDLIVRQLGGEEGYTPASVLRNDGQFNGQSASQSNNTLLNNRAGSEGIDLDKTQKLFGIERKVDANTGFELPSSRIRRSTAEAATESSSAASERLNFESPQDFIDKIMPYSEQAQAKLGVPKEAILAQAALETGWGQKIIQNKDGTSSHNLFNIKADKRWDGDYATKDTLEFEQGTMVRKQAPFRSYDSIAESVNDYVDFLSNSDRYKSLINNNLNVDQFLQGLQKAGYATDPDYANKISSVVNKIVSFMR